MGILATVPMVHTRGLTNPFYLTSIHHLYRQLLSDDLKCWNLLTYGFIIAQFCRLLGYNTFAVHSALGMNARESIKVEFTTPVGSVEILVLSYLVSNEGLNLHPCCHRSVMVEQGLNYSMEHQAWSRVRRIGQIHKQFTERLVNLDTIDLLIEEAQRLKQSPMLHAFGVMMDCGADVQTDQVYDTLIGKRTPQSLKDAVIVEIKTAEPKHASLSGVMEIDHSLFRF